MSNVYHSLASGTFFQNWSDPNLITTDDDWNGVPSIIGYRGDGLVSSTGVNPTTVTGTSTLVDVNANRSDPSVFATGGVVEFDGIANRVVGIQGSGTADAPYIVVHLDATGRQDITFSTLLRDIDTGTAAVQPIAVQYRVGDTGAWQNVTGGFVANANLGGDTLLTVTLPAAANNAAQLQVRVITTDAAGSDAFIGIDDITVTSDPLVVVSHGTLSIGDASVTEGDSGSAAMTFTVNRLGGDDGAVSATWTIGLAGTANAADLAAAQPLSGTVNFADGQTSATITINVAGDTAFEPNETFTVTLSAPTGGAVLGDLEATGTIVNDDPLPPAGQIFINEIHYDPSSSPETGEAVEIAGPAGTSLAGWTLVLYNGNGGGTYGTIALSGTFGDQDDGYGTLSFLVPGLQNGAPDGIALVAPGGTVVQFLSYEGTMTATNGPANGLTSVDIGVSEDQATPGTSLRLVGAGASYADFSWAPSAPSSFGGVNTGQDFIGPNATGLVSVADVSVAEGHAGTTPMVFTVHRAGGLGQEASVDWVLELTSGATADDLAAGQPLSGHIVFGVGVASVDVVVNVAGDTLGEPNETLRLLLANPAGNIQIVDSAAVGTIRNDDLVERAIYEIQGEGHRSAYEGQPVLTTGIVTAVDSNGFYLQDPAGDGNDATSDGIFVFTGSAPTVAAGDAVSVRGTVQEFGGGFNLSTTEIVSPVVTLLSSGNALPAATIIGVGGRLPPTEIIDDDGFSVFDPASDGIDFYESLEGMMVTIQAPLVVSNTGLDADTWVVASGGAGATGLNARGGITISEGDFNPERIQLFGDATLSPGYDPNHTQGDLLGDVTGVMSYGDGNFRLLVTGDVTVTHDEDLGRETTTLAGGRDHLTVASYNVQNLDPTDLDPTDPDGDQFDLLAGDIVYSLLAPDIIGLQEMQDGNGLGGTDPLSAAYTAQLLIDAIEEAGGPSYIYVEIAPSAPNTTGGEGGGNIRNGYLYNPDRVSFVEGSLALITGPAFGTSHRKPLVATFTFNGENVTLINHHSVARLGSDSLFGANQPPENAGDDSRTAQATAIRAYVEDLLLDNPSLKLGVLGDFNGFVFEDAVRTLEAGGVMTDLHHLLAEAEQYSAWFQGNLQAIDHLLVTGGLYSGAAFDVVHLNAERFGSPRGTDHDPILARLFIEHPNEAPAAGDDAVAVDEDASTANLWNQLLGNDTDPDPEDTHSIVAVDTTGTLGSLVFDPDTQTLVYVADGDAFDLLAPGATMTDSFTYTVTDQHGLTDTATVTVTVTGIDDGVSIGGGNGADTVIGDLGEDVLEGGNGADVLRGIGGHDWLLGGNGEDRLFGGDGRDRLEGGRGDDELSGGTGGDLFVLGKSGGNDTVLDYEVGVDQLFLTDGIAVQASHVHDANHDGHDDLTLFLGSGGTVTLLGIDDIALVDFATPADLSNYPPF